MDLDYELYAPSYRLPCLSKRITFSLGHIFNDLTSTVYYNFVILYLMNVAVVHVDQVGYVFLFGQVVSAVATVMVNHIGQHRNALCCCYTRRKSWHLLGAVLVAGGFLFLFMACIGCTKVDSVFKTIYYGGFIMFFQLGWSFMQNAHLHLIPEITRNQHERIELNAIRYTIGLACKIVVFAVIWLLFSLSTSSSIDADDSKWFRILAITITTVGIVTIAVFHLGTEETGFDLFIETHISSDNQLKMSKTQWTKEPQYYQIIFLHFFTRLSINVATMYLPLYITQTLNLHKVYVAVYAFAAFTGSAIIPFATRPLARCSTPKATYLLGAVLVMGVAAWAWFITTSWPMYQMQVFGMVVTLGAGGSATTLSALTMTQALIGDNTESGSFVYSTMSVFEKVFTGTAVLVIQQLTGSLGTDGASTYYRYIFTGVVGGAAAAGFLVLLTLLIVKIGNLRYTGVLISASLNNEKREERQPVESHMKVFEPTPTEDCFNYWSCLSTTQETEAQYIAIIYSSPHDLSDLQACFESTSSINNSPYDVPGLRRTHSYEGTEGPMMSASLRPSLSAPSVIEYSGNHEQHHRRKNTPRISSKDTAQLIDNEEVPEPTQGLPPGNNEASAATGAAAAAAAAAAGDGAAGGQETDPSGTSTQVDVHPIPDNIHAGSKGDATPEGQGTQGSPYDNVPIRVTPGGKIIDNESTA